MEEKSGNFWAVNRLGSLVEHWPKNSAGEPEEPVLLCHCECLDMSDRMRINMLEAYGIPCVCRDSGNGAFGRVVLGISGEGVDIFVPKSLLEDALALSEEEYHEEL